MATINPKHLAPNWLGYLTPHLEQLRIGTIKVRNVLGEDVPVSSKEIEDSLWHYYYDVDKTVNYLLSRYVRLDSPC